MSSASLGDLTPQARIRRAAIELFGAQGFSKTTVRQIAERAGVSAPLVMHHFGSRDGLRRACDDWAIDYFSDEKTLLALGGGLQSMSVYLAEHPEFGAIVDYLVAGLREGGQIADEIWQRLMTMTLQRLEIGAEQGAMHLPDDLEAAAAYMVAASVGVMLMSSQFARTLGGDSLDDPRVINRYALAVTEIYANGLFTPAYAAALRASLGSPSQPVGDTEQQQKRQS